MSLYTEILKEEWEKLGTFSRVMNKTFYSLISSLGRLLVDIIFLPLNALLVVLFWGYLWDIGYKILNALLLFVSDHPRIKYSQALVIVAVWIIIKFPGKILQEYRELK